MMGKIKVLDCTLRDGGYCNQWRFGRQNIAKIINGLMETGIDIIECGFITNRVSYDEDVSRFRTFEEVGGVIPKDREGRLFVCMINFGEYSISEIPEYDGTSVDGIRVAFHKKDLAPAMEFCREIKDKGYLVFIQAMVSLSYSDEEFLSLIRLANDIEPFAFYIVDSFGVMKRRDLVRLFYMVEHDLKFNINIGYHSHNNMQLAYSNAQTLVDIGAKHDMIIDSSVFGMGRGAGNLNTELFVEYLNDNIESEYRLKPLLTIIDEILSKFYQTDYWGYSLPNYLSAKHNSHPNYAGYLDAKKTLTVEAMDEIFSMMDDAKRSSYDKDYIEKLYTSYLANGYVQETHLNELKERIKDKTILIIAPGRSSIDEKDKIIVSSQKKNTVTISVNYDYPECETDYIFISNLRRFRELDISKRSKCIATSNIPSTDVYLQAKYKDLLNGWETVRDNAGMMLIKLLITLGAGKILLAGFDGYSVDPESNFADKGMSFYTEKAVFEAMNNGMTEALREFKKQINIDFVTTPKYVII